MREFLDSQRAFTLFLVLGLGYMLGRLRLGPVSLGPVAGVLFVGLLLGHFGFTMSPGAQAVGFALFIFSVGYQAGPRFFDVVRKDGLRYLSVALVVGATGATVALLVSRIAGLAWGTSAGVLAGGMTSSAALASAQEALRTGAVAVPEGSVAEAIDNATTGYAVTYILSLVGVILAVKVLPRVLGVDLASEAAQIERAEAGVAEPRPPVFRAWAVSNPEILAEPISALRQRWDGFTWIRVRRDEQMLLPSAAGALRASDEVVAFGDERFMPLLQDLGDEVTAKYADRAREEQAHVIVTSSDVAGRTLDELSIATQYGVYVEGLSRGGKRLPRSRDVRVSKGDVLEIRGPALHIDALGDAFGKVVRPKDVTNDMTTIFLAIAAGLLVGTFSVQISETRISLGAAGGLLLAGVLMGFANAVRPTVGRMSAGARAFLMDLGLLIFMVGIGLRAGATIVETLLQNGVLLVLCGAAVTASAVGVGLVFAGKVLRLNPAVGFGAVVGAMTSGAALSVVTGEARSEVPSLGYTGTYAFANVLLTILGTVVLNLG